MSPACALRFRFAKEKLFTISVRRSSGYEGKPSSGDSVNGLLDTNSAGVFTKQDAFGRMIGKQQSDYH